MFHGRTVLSAIVVAGASMLVATPVFAQMTGASDTPAAAQPDKLKGLWLTTGFPSRSADIGSSVNVDLDLQNKALPPQLVQLSVDGLPSGWKSEFVGGGSDVAAAMVKTGESRSFRPS